jgi:hypothetical protein
MSIDSNYPAGQEKIDDLPIDFTEPEPEVDEPDYIPGYDDGEGKIGEDGDA